MARVWLGVWLGVWPEYCLLVQLMAKVEAWL